MSNPIVVADLAHHGMAPADTFDGVLQQTRQAASGRPSDKYLQLAERLSDVIQAAAVGQVSLKGQ